MSQKITLNSEKEDNIRCKGRNGYFTLRGYDCFVDNSGDYAFISLHSIRRDGEAPIIIEGKPYQIQNLLSVILEELDQYIMEVEDEQRREEET